MKKIVTLLLVFVLFVPMALAEEMDQAKLKSLILDVIKENPKVIKDALETYEKELAEKQKEEEFNKLLADKVVVDIGNSPIRGEKKADYTIIAFSDFQCPFCRRGDDTIKELQKKYEKKLRYSFKHFPLSFHPEAAFASKAAWAAGEQGKFFEYHDKLFENQAKLGEELYVQLAKDLGIDIEKFNKDRASENAEKQIQADMKQAQDLGINGTPGFIVNGVKVYGAYPLDYFEKIFSRLDMEKTAKKQDKVEEPEPKG